MKRSEIQPLPQFFDRYINLVEDIDIVEALEKYATIETLLDRTTLLRLEDKVYAPGKWTSKEMIQHLTDNERIQAYRALRIGRNDQTPLPGYNENIFAAHNNSKARDLNELLDEFAVTRKSNIYLFKNLPDEAQKRTGICNNVTISALALGFVLVGHQLHHINIIKERYLPLIDNGE